jgi:predicted transcriptional regulator
MSENSNFYLLSITAQIVSAHLSQNHVEAAAVPDLIQSVYKSLSTAGEIEAVAQELTPAVPIKRSVFPNYLVCLDDGKKLKMLKRHLSTSYNMTPADYRVKWGLPHDYPMVAPNYAAIRSSLAKQIGLGRKSPPKVTPSSDLPENDEASAEPKVKQVRARRAKGSRG